ncbi:hypothetical protein KM911_18135 [Bacillus paralicheniformis]|uniref:hypothetical protein n=1 Tax=Bacillus TaxID=1386 RepID=UPI001C223384|nr:hypothetical protein [Bacillus paralicheniformis]MBU8583621.1 hypothetical protein [Bacillus paralicheniformis]
MVKTDDTAAVTTDGNHTKNTAAAIIKEKGTVITITKESIRNFSAAAKSRENIDEMAV